MKDILKAMYGSADLSGYRGKSLNFREGSLLHEV